MDPAQGKLDVQPLEIEVHHARLLCCDHQVGSHWVGKVAVARASFTLLRGWLPGWAGAPHPGTCRPRESWTQCGTFE